LLTPWANTVHHRLVVTSIVLALIAAVSGLLSSVWTLQRQQKAQKELEILRRDHDRETRAEQRRLAASEQLDKYREPLILAAVDLWQRVDNIRLKNFRWYFDRADSEWRGRIAVLGTLYRFAKYWSVVDQLRRSIGVLRFETDEDTRATAHLLSEIDGTLSSDSRFGGRTLMVWREEQRGVAELMRSPEPNDTVVSIIGFASFVDTYAQRLKPWLSDFERDLRSTGVEESPRMAELQRLLGQLIDQLDPGRVYVSQGSALRSEAR